MDKKSQRKHDRLQTDLKFFCEHAPMIIKDKSGKMKKLVFNRAQKFIHERLEAQLKAIGKVRAWILKGRQQGCSTYISARFYHKTTRKKGISTFILSHEGTTTDKLFKLVKRYQDKIHGSNKPSTQYSNRKEIVFNKMESDYAVGTAGNEDIGRGGTVQLFHGSECAFWDNTDELQTGLLQSIPDDNDTEIIFESTANGMGNMFHKGVMDALKGETEYIVIFVPWYWQEEYSKTAPKSFILDEEEGEYKKLYKLTNDQMCWRREKIKTLGGIHKFRQEYPANIHEAFQVSGEGLIKPEWIMKARECTVTSKESPLIIGVDPARDGDRTVIAFRRNREFPKIYIKDNMNQMRLAGILAALIDRHQPAKCFIDVGHGYGTIDRLHELGYESIVTGVNFGETALEDDKYMNKRAEMWLNMRDWIEREGVSIPDDDELHSDLAIMPDYLETSSGKKRLISKDKIKEMLGKSPDIGDAMCLTFAYPVKSNSSKIPSRKKGSQVTTLSRQREMKTGR